MPRKTKRKKDDVKKRNGQGALPPRAEKKSKGSSPRVNSISRDEEPPADESQDRRSHIVNLRVPMQIVEDIDYWVEKRRYKSRSEFVLASIRFYLDYIEYRESYNVRTFERGQREDVPSERFDRLRYLKGQG